MRILVVAEKPSVGRDIARVLKANKAPAGAGYMMNDSYVVTWAVGHLVTLMDPEEVDGIYKKWAWASLPILPDNIPLKVIKETQSQFDVVKKLMLSDKISSVICATDSGREGELIFRYIYQMAGCTKPCQRLWISSMTDAAINAGFAALKPSSCYDGLYASAQCRSEADWLVGMNATRAFTLRYNALLSAGRVQTPTLALIVARDKEIADFVIRDYWEVSAQFEAWKGTWFQKETKGTRIETEEAAQAIADKVKGKPATVTEFNVQKKHVPPEKLYDLTTLQREANRKYGYNAEKTLKLAQSLYETHKLFTYPRTDSRYLPDDMESKVYKTLSLLPEPYAAYVQAIKPFKRADRIYDNAKITDHHAIIPTDKQPNLASLTQDERNLYDMVARRLIANHYPEYVYDACSIVTECEGEAFKTNLNKLSSLGWKELYKDDEKSKDKDKVLVLPDLKVGDKTILKKATVQLKHTEPPQRYTDDTLLKAMEDAGKSIQDEELREKMKDAGLGTPATRAAIITRLITVGYVVREKKNLVSTEKGRKFISVAPQEMTQAVTTGKWERALAKIAQLNDAETIAEKRKKFMDSIRRYSAFLTDYARTSCPSVVFPTEEYRGRKPSPKAVPAKKKTPKRKETDK